MRRRRTSKIEAKVSRSSLARRVSLLGVVGTACLLSSAPACHQFDTSRDLPARGSVGTEMYGVLCDRVAAQALREDLTGASFHDLCHKTAGGQFADSVNTSLLPPITGDAVDTKGNPVSAAQQIQNRNMSVGKVEALGRRRDDLIRALDATFPAGIKIPVKDLANADPTKSCNALSTQGLLTTELASLLGRMGPLYTDGTLPQSTESLSRVVDVFRTNIDAEQAWQRISARQGYRPIDTALGVVRPVVSYPNLRDLSNASLSLLSADSQPYQLNPSFDASGNRIPIAGPANAAFNKMLETAHAELLNVTADPPLTPLVQTTDPTGRVIISRARDNIEMLQQVLFTDNDAFVNGASNFIVRRDTRGYARIRDGAVPAPFVDADGDGLPDIDDVGNFKTSDGSVAPSPFSYPGSAAAQRDGNDRAMTGDGGLLYDYLDTSRTFAAQMMKDLKPLVNSDPTQNHETLMYMMGGLPIMMGPRSTVTKTYANGINVQYDGISTDDSPLLDIIYAMGVVLGDQTTDATLSMAEQLFTTQSASMARVTGDMNAAFDVAAKHTEAAIPRTSTFWDENLDLMGQLAEEPGLLEDVLHALADPASAQIGTVFSKFAQFQDQISYDINNINGAAFDVTTNTAQEASTPVDRTQPITGKNRSQLMRFLQLISDTVGVAACNKDGAKVDVDGIQLPIVSFKECEVFKINDLAIFYLQSVGDAFHNGPPNADPPPGTIYMRPGALRIASSGSLIASSAGIDGMYDTGGGLGSAVAPMPTFLDRLVFFDWANDQTNTRTRKFLEDLNGETMGTSVCPERVIDDPSPDAKDADSDGKVHGLRNCADGQFLQQRDKYAIFSLENFGFYDAMKPLIAAFIKHGREDLFVKMSATVYKHLPGQDASVDECLIPGGSCPRDNMQSYEPLVAETFAGDIFPALGAIVKTLDTMSIKVCGSAVDSTGACPADQVQQLSGIQVVAAATRAAVDPKRAAAIGLTDRKGNVGTVKNDGSPVAQVTPAYLLTNALLGVDLAFDKYEQQHPDQKDRRANWRKARSQLVDQFLGVNGIESNSSFANPSIPNMSPVIIDMLRSQMWSHCPNTFIAPADDSVTHEKCTWATSDLVSKATDTLAGPLAVTGIDVMDAIRGDQNGRVQMEKMMEYLLDPSSGNNSLASVLASSNDILQILRDDTNIVPLMTVAASAADASKYDNSGHLTQKSMVDAQMALLARMNGQYLDKSGKEICKNEVDANQVLTAVLAKLVTPISDNGFNGQTPLEVIIDVIADVNRVDPTAKYDGTLRQPDYANMSTNVVSFLTDPQNGLEQFYEVVRNGLK